MVLKYRYVLFDWDGCLANTLEVWMGAYRKVFELYGVRATKKEIAYHFGDWEAPKYFGITDIDGCFEKIDAIANEELKQVALHKGVMDTLNSLKKDRKMAVLSSTPREKLEAAMGFNKIRNFFEVTLAGEDVKHHKPHPEVIEKGLGKLRGSKKEAVMIGDSRKDLEAASNAGIDSILYYPPEHKIFYSLNDLKKYKPTYIASNFDEILVFLQKKQ